MAVTTTAPPAPTAAAASRRGGAVAVTAVLVLLIAALALADIAQGTSGVGAAEVWKALTGQADAADASVVVASRLPRMTAGILVGAALGMAGAALQAVSRNVIAAPDTLAVNAGSYLALGLAAATGVSLPLLASSGVAFVGGLAAAAVVLGVSGLGGGTVRLVLAGSALTLGLTSVTEGLLLLFPERTEGLYAWNQGSIAQNGFGGVLWLLPLAVAGLAGLLLVARRVDTLALGDDAARGLGVPVRATRVITVVLAALLSATAVTLAGPIGFVGLSAPALVRLLARRYGGFSRTRASVTRSALTGAALVLGSDVALRAVVPADVAVAVPTGVVTSLVGAVFLVVLATRGRDTGAAAPPDRLRIRSRTVFLTVTGTLVAVLIAVIIASVLLGDSKLLLGDVVNWAQGRAGRAVSFVLDTRVPRVLAALLAGAALALAGTLVQAVTRNPLAEPGVMGVSGGAALGAVILVTSAPGAWAGGSGRRRVRGRRPRRGARLRAVRARRLPAEPPGAGRYGRRHRERRPDQPVHRPDRSVQRHQGADLAVRFDVRADAARPAAAGRRPRGGLAVAVARRTELDLISLDEDTPRLLGLGVPRARLGLLTLGVLLSAAAVAASGTIAFVGLVAPHAARALVGRRHVRVVPVAVLLGAALVGTADVVGRTVIAPAQLGAGLLTAVIGTPYFLWLLVRTRGGGR
ncbi:Vitamin B12 import system permease protein BtuC [Streptomyces rimosus subsp. rimosus]